ncbi:MAG: hypothetical protein ACN4GT_08280 [Gammaproteobacteria bacterium]
MSNSFIRIILSPGGKTEADCFNGEKNGCCGFTDGFIRTNWRQNEAR